MKWIAGSSTRRSSLGLGLGLWLTALAAGAQPSPKPAVQALPSAAISGSDTAHLVSQYTRRGVRFAFRECGTGPLPKAGSRVAIRYTGFLPDGHVFDANVTAGGPLRFRVGRGEVIAGWDELLPLLPVGSRVRAWVPAQLAYGPAGVRDPEDDNRFLIPPNTELIFELLVLSAH